MKALLIGGTGTISAAVTARLSSDPNWEVWLLNRGSRGAAVPGNVHQIICDIKDEAAAAEKLRDLTFDTACEFIGYRQEDVERDYRLLNGKVKQYIFTSSASAYHKPAPGYLVNEGTALANPYWQYSRDKIACEAFLMRKYREDGFPVTIVRPSHTYDERKVPVCLHGKNGSWQVLKRMLEGKRVIIPGDGTSLWTLTFNRDFAVGYTGLMGNRHAIGEAFQITADETLTWNQIHETVAGALGVKLRAYHVASEYLADAGKKYGYDFEGNLLGDKSSSVVFDNTKLKRAVPRMTTAICFHQGAHIAVDYVLSHPEECQKDDPEFDAWCDRVIAALEASKASV